MTSDVPSQPAPDLTPQDVVLAQLAGLQREPAEGTGAGPGLRACWQFASPGNQAATGPVERFATMLRNPLYVGLLGHRTVHLGPLSVDGRTAHQEVLVLTSDDRTEGYTWVLGCHEGPPADGCWLTEAVVRHDAGDGR